MVETTIATLNLGNSCLLTLTSKHLRGQFLRLVNQDGSKTTIKDQIDVVLSGIAGYTIQHIDNSLKRIKPVAIGVLLAMFGFCFSSTENGFGPAAVGIIVGGAIGLIGWLLNPDEYFFAINVMGSQTLIPIVSSYSKAVQDFINELQNAKVEYEESR